MAHKFSIDSVEKLLLAVGKIKCEIAWDMDNDIENDINSDDNETRKAAKKFEKSGLTKAYLNENIDYISKSFLKAAKAAGAHPVSLKADFNSLSVEINSQKILTFTDALNIFKSELLNLNEGGSIYIQGCSYFQLTNFTFHTKSGGDYDIKSWRAIDAINNLAIHQNKLAKRKKVIVVPNSLYLSINGSVIYIKNKRDWDGNNPSGVIVTQKGSRYSGGKYSSGDELMFNSDGSVAGLETVEFLPFHPDSVFALLSEISISLPDSDSRLFGYGDSDVQDIA